MTLSTKDATLAEITVRISKLCDHMSTAQDKYMHDAVKSALKAAAAELVVLLDNYPDFDPAAGVAISKEVAPHESSRDRHASNTTTLSSPSRASDQVTPSTRPPSQPRSFAHPINAPTSRIWKASDEQRQRPIAVVPDFGASKIEAHVQTLLEEEYVPHDPRKQIVQRFPPPSISPLFFPAAAINSYGAPTPTIDLKDVCPCSLIGHSCPNPEECGLVSVCVYWHKSRLPSQPHCICPRPHVNGTCRDWREDRLCVHGSKCYHGHDAPGENVRRRKMEEHAEHHAQMSNLANGRRQEQHERRMEGRKRGSEIEEGEVGEGKEHGVKRERHS